MKYTKPDLAFTVLESKAGLAFATRFLDLEMAGSDQDTWISTSLSSRRGLVNKFQKLVMDIFCDDLFMETILETPDSELDQDVFDTYQIYKEFITMFPSYDVIGIVPMNITGTMGFITELKTSPDRRL